MSDYGREDYLAAIAAANEAGDTAAVNELAAVLEKMDLEANPPKEMTTGQFVMENARRGATEGTAFLSAAAQKGLIDPLNAALATDLGRKGSFSEVYSANQDTAQSFINELLGQSEFTERDIQANDPSGGLLPSAIRGGADLTNLLARPARWVAETFLGATGGAGSEIGGDVGEKVAETAGVDPTTGRLIGSIAGGTGGSVVASKTTSGVIGVVDKAKQGLNYAKSGEGAKTYAGKAAQNILRNIAEERGVTHINEIVSEFDKISSVVDVSKFPLLVQMSESKIVADQIANLASRDPAFRATVEGELTKLTDAITAKADDLFGMQQKSLTGFEVNPELKAKAANAEKAVAVLDQRLDQLASPLSEAKYGRDVGQDIATLVQRKSDAVRASMVPQYESLKAAAMDAGVVMPSASTQQIWEYVKQNNMSDIFGKGSEIEKLINQYFSPRKPKTPDVEILDSRGKPLNPVDTKAKSPDVSFDNVMSLKNRINELQRKNLTPTEERRLAQLEAVVDQARTSMGDWDAKLRQLDSQYYEKLGVPFGQRAVYDMTHKGYTDQVAPILFKTGAMHQYLTAVGPEGVPVARNAVLAKMHKEVMTDGVISDKKLATFMSNHKNTIEAVPGLADELATVAQNNGSLLRDHAAALADQKRIQDDVIYAKLLAEDPNLKFDFRTTANLKPEKVTSFLQNVRKLDPRSQEAVMGRLRREVLQVAFDSKGGALSFLTNPNHQSTLSLVMGSKYSDDLKALARLSDLVSNADARVTGAGYNQSSARLDPLERATGVDVNYATSQLRDRISSLGMKVTRLISRAYSTKLKSVEDKEMAKILLNPDALSMLADVARTEAKGGKLDMPNLNMKLGEALSTLTVRHSTRSMTRALASEKAEEDARRAELEAIARRY